MTIEAIIALTTGVLGLANSIWAHRRVTAAEKAQAPVTKAELYGTPPIAVPRPPPALRRKDKP